MNYSSSTPLSEAARILDLEKKLAWAEMRIQVLEERLRLQRIKKYGPGSEKLNPAQLELLEFEPGVSNAEVAAEAARGDVPERKPRRQRPHPGRQHLPTDLPRVESVIPCTPEQCTCAACGQSTVVIGHEVSEYLDVEPARYFVAVSRREKRACPHCQDGGVATASAPSRIIDKCLVSDRIVIDTVVAKYGDHLPLYRQSAILERETGVEISRATMDGWVMKVGELLSPIAEAMRRELLLGTYLQADETTVDVQMHDGRGQNHQAYLWQYGRPGAGVVFDFRMGRGRDGPKGFLGQFEGVLQTDGYSAYDRVGGPKLAFAACWAHARRKFFEAVKLNPQDAAAARIVTLIDELFGIDRRAREERLDNGARHALRRQTAPAVLEGIQREIQAVGNTHLPASAIGRAASYTLSLWKRLTQFLNHPEVELSNNLAENSMRPVALGRKNWIHIGSRHAGPKVAAILSVTESCRRLQIPIRSYLGDVLPGLANLPVQRCGALTPAAWSANHTPTPAPSMA